MAQRRSSKSRDLTLVHESRAHRSTQGTQTRVMRAIQYARPALSAFGESWPRPDSASATHPNVYRQCREVRTVLARTPASTDELPKLTVHDRHVNAVRCSLGRGWRRRRERRGGGGHDDALTRMITVIPNRNRGAESPVAQPEALVPRDSTSGKNISEIRNRTMTR